MVKSFRFLLQFAWINLAAVLGFAAIVIVGCYATGVPRGTNNLFGVYFRAFPLMSLYMIYMFGLALCTSNLNLGLSFGAKRRDFFWAMQGVVVSYAGVFWLLQVFMSALPRLGSWNDYNGLWIVGGIAWQGVFPLLCLAVILLGCLSGLAMVRSKVAGIVLIVAAVLFLLVGTIILSVLADLKLWNFLSTGEWSGLWNCLPFALLGAAVLIVLVSEAIIWRTVGRFMVR